MNKRQKHLVLNIAILIFFIVWVFIAFYWQYLLKKNHELYVGRVYHYTCGGRGDAGRIWIDFQYEIKGKKYSASSLYSTSEIKCGDIDHLLNRSLPIIYNPKHPSISRLLLLPGDFAKNGITFPDSLNWLLPYFKE